tara:strand:- start:179 stop:1147 length:969 start_codon:yes stop_codon:yes gene_type:complete
MKKVLLTTSALVAFAGYAAAEVSFGGEVTVGYNDVEENGIFLDGSLDITGTAEFDNGVSVEVTYGLDLYDGSFDNFPTVTVTTPWATLTVGDVEYAGTDMFEMVDGMDDTHGFREVNDELVVRVDVTFGGFTIGVSADTNLYASNNSYPTNELSIGAMGEFGAFSFTAGYDQAEDMIGVSVGTTFGNFEVDLAYLNNTHDDDSIGLGVATTFGDIGVSAYYAFNSGDDDEYGLSVDYATGPVTIGAYWEADSGGYSNVGVDVGYAVNDNISVAAGYDQDDGAYIYGLMMLGNATVGAGWAEYTEAGDEEIREGVSVWLTMPF